MVQIFYLPQIVCNSSPVWPVPTGLRKIEEKFCNRGLMTEVEISISAEMG